MCVRFTLFVKAEELEVEFDLTEKAPVPPSYNIAPSQGILIVTQNAESHARNLHPAHWGLIPSWTKNPNEAPKPINARFETLTQKPYYKKAFQKQRCVNKHRNLTRFFLKTARKYDPGILSKVKENLLSAYKN